MAGISRAFLLAAGTGLALLAMPARADHLDPRVAGPLQQMFRLAAMQCQQGNPQACQRAQQMRRVEMDLSRAQHACQAGNGQACQYFQNGAQQVVGAWQQQQQAGMIQGGGMAGGGQGYSSQQMTQDHQQRMRQQQQQFQQHQDRMRQQQNQFDQQNQRWLEQHRR
ncbi:MULTISPECIES: hypothetical protein [Roseomonadaceae]|uniref:Uncharacterized protein n=1 Tax=Falsiroseomonas oleicola TaxID=2801474 RepID=A0ABS6HFZ3_9PROT|nr:hypothetical protein [Roseomonas oleicola]MBU8546687.1 hypothetical protein [Roseomonas oleicola]